MTKEMATRISYLTTTLTFILLALSSNLATSNQQVVFENEATPEAQADLITSLPGQPNVSFQQFSGYVTVNHVSGRALFYWLTQAVSKPLSKPLVIWLNGGQSLSLSLLLQLLLKHMLFVHSK